MAKRCTGVAPGGVEGPTAAGLQDPENWLMKPGEVAALFRVDPKTPVRWVKNGWIEAVRTGGSQHRFWRKDVLHLLKYGPPKKTKKQGDKK